MEKPLFQTSVSQNYIFCDRVFYYNDLGYIPIITQEVPICDISQTYYKKFGTIYHIRYIATGGFCV